MSDTNTSPSPAPPAAPTFSKGYIAPTRGEAERHAAKFYELITYLRATRNGNPSWKRIGDEIGVDQSNAKRRVDNKSLDDHERKVVLDYIFDESDLIIDPASNRIHEIRDNLYFALLDFYHVKATSQDNTRAEVIGTYRLWRKSVEHNGHYVFGRIDIYEDERSHALCVTMKQPLKPRPGMRGSTEQFRGYFLRVADMYVMLLRDIAKNDLRITIFRLFRSEQVGTDFDPGSIYPGSIQHVVHMDGHGMGMDGRNLFASPVCLELVDNKAELDQLDDRIDVVPERDTPELILAKLKQFPHVVR